MSHHRASTDGWRGDRRLAAGADAGRDAVRTALTGQPQTAVFTYLANTMRVRDREVPYSLVTGVNAAGFEKAAAGAAPRIVLNTWAARDLAAFPGDRLTMEYYVWEEPGRLATRTAAFEVGGIVPIETGSRDLAPAYPGISNTSSVSEWDPPFPLDLRRVRPIDEDYWNRYRTTPKAFVDLETARALWGSRYGSLTSIRVPAASGQPAEAAVAQVRASLHGAIDAESFGLSVRDIRSEGLAASQGATDFGEYFLYFSFFLVVSALLLVVLFFKLGVEQRVREVGLLRAVGLSPSAIRRLFTTEGLILPVPAASRHCRCPSRLLTTRHDAGPMRRHDRTDASRLGWRAAAERSAASRVSGLHLVDAAHPRAHLERACWRRYLPGDGPDVKSGPRRGGPRSRRPGARGARSSGLVPQQPGFRAGGALLVSALTPRRFCCGDRRAAASATAGGRSPRGRNAGYRPGRSVLSMAVIASATFILVSVDAFRRGAGSTRAIRTAAPAAMADGQTSCQSARSHPGRAGRAQSPIARSLGDHRALRVRPGTMRAA